jgi:hypothetical protein
MISADVRIDIVHVLDFGNALTPALEGLGRMKWAKP